MVRTHTSGMSVLFSRTRIVVASQYNCIRSEDMIPDLLGESFMVRHVQVLHHQLCLRLRVGYEIPYINVLGTIPS
jgi:hypothetical protein